MALGRAGSTPAGIICSYGRRLRGTGDTGAIRIDISGAVAAVGEAAPTFRTIWKSEVRVEGRSVYLGLFETAVEAYEKAKEYLTKDGRL